MAVTTEEEVIWAEPISTGTSAQQKELPALSKAQKRGKGRRLVSTMTASMLVPQRVHGSMYKERGLLTTEEKKSKIKEKILVFLKALWLPKKLATICCPSHQRSDRPIPRERTWPAKPPNRWYFKLT